MKTITDKLSEYQKFKSILCHSQNEWFEKAKENIVFNNIEEYVEFNDDKLNLLGLEITDNNDFGLYYLNEDCDKMVMKIIEVECSKEKYNTYLEKLSKL